MKKSQILAALALAFALGVATPAFTIANSPAVAATSAACTGHDTGSDYQTDNSTTATVCNYDQLSAAINDSGITSIVVADDITLTNTITISRDVNIDLGGHTLTISATAPTKQTIFHVAQGDVFITNGYLKGHNTPGAEISTNALVSVNGSTNVNDTNYTTLTLDRNVSIESTSNGFGLAVLKGGAHGITVNVYGRIAAVWNAMSINGLVTPTQNVPTMNIYGTLESTDGDAAIYAAGYGIWNISGATITGGTAIGAKSGVFHISGSTLTATATYNPNVTILGEGINPNGAVFQIEHHSSYPDGIVFDIQSGTFVSEQGAVFTESSHANASDRASSTDIDIAGGTFKAANGEKIFDGGDIAKNKSISIDGGTFKGTDVKDFYDNGYLTPGAVVSSDGTVVTPTSSRPSSSSTATNTATSSDGRITVTGKFAGNIKVEYTTSSQKVGLFGTRDYVMYDIYLTNAAGQKLVISEPVTVKIKVPANINGSKSSIYYVQPGLDGAQRLASSYSNSVITFTTTHFSYYAIVEDNGQIVDGATQNNSSAGVTNPNGSTTAPDTAAIANSDGSASTTVAMVASLATTLTAAGAGVVAYRNARRSTRK